MNLCVCVCVCARRFPPGLPVTEWLTGASACLRLVSHSDEAGQSVLSEILTPPPLPSPPLPPRSRVIDANEKLGQWFFQAPVPRIMTRIRNEAAETRSETDRWDVINKKIF